MTEQTEALCVRRAAEADIPRLAELLLQVNAVHAEGRPDLFRMGESKYTDEQLHSLLGDADCHILVAELAGRGVVGYAFCLEKSSGDNHALQPVTSLYIDDLCVDERCRGCGVGRLLYDSTVELARQLGCHNLTLNVWTCNPSAMAFYERLGLQKQKVGMELLLK